MQRLCLVPVGDVEVMDTWHVDGMVATGSRDIVATTLFVPDTRVSLAPPPTWLRRPRDDAVPAALPGAAVPVAHGRDPGARRARGAR